MPHSPGDETKHLHSALGLSSIGHLADCVCSARAHLLKTSLFQTLHRLGRMNFDDIDGMLASEVASPAIHKKDVSVLTASS